MQAPTYNADEEDAMDAMIAAEASEESSGKKQERESPETVVPKLKSIVSQMQALLDRC